MFTKGTEQFAEATNNTVDATYNFWQTSINSIEKLAKIQLEISRKIIDETSQTVKDMTTCSSSKDFFDKVNQFANNTTENNICNCKDAYEVLTDTQTKLGKVFETFFQNAQQNVNDTVDTFAKFNPTKSNFVNDSLKTFTSNASQVFDAFNKATSQVAEFTHKNILATTNVAKNTTTKKSSTTTSK